MNSTRSRLVDDIFGNVVRCHPALRIRNTGIGVGLAGIAVLTIAVGGISFLARVCLIRSRVIAGIVFFRRGIRSLLGRGVFSWQQFDLERAGQFFRADVGGGLDDDDLLGVARFVFRDDAFAGVDPENGRD